MLVTTEPSQEIIWRLMMSLEAQAQEEGVELSLPELLEAAQKTLQQTA